MNRARWYDPRIGRWLSEDPIGFAAGDGNLYRYVGNNATNLTDPSGNEPFTIALIAGAFLATASVGLLYNADRYFHKVEQELARPAAQTKQQAIDNAMWWGHANLTAGSWAMAGGSVLVTAGAAAPLVVGASPVVQWGARAIGLGTTAVGAWLSVEEALWISENWDRLNGWEATERIGTLAIPWVMLAGMAAVAYAPWKGHTAAPNTSGPRARHHTDLEGMRGIQRDGAINPARADPPVNTGVHVETHPFRVCLKITGIADFDSRREVEQGQVPIFAP